MSGEPRSQEPAAWGWDVGSWAQRGPWLHDHEQQEENERQPGNRSSDSIAIAEKQGGEV